MVFRSLQKANKFALARELQKSGPAVDDIEEYSAWIIDGMKLVQKLKGDGETCPNRYADIT